MQTGCGSESVGALRIEDVPAVAAEPCPPPEAYLGAASSKVLSGRLGDALKECEAKRAMAVQYARDIKAAVGK